MARDYNKTLEALKKLDPMDAMTLHACLLHCATMKKEDRQDFQKVYGTKADKNITKLVQDLQR
jgi:hypothetical protein